MLVVKSHIPTIQEIRKECQKPSVQKKLNNLKLQKREGLYTTDNYKLYVPSRFRFGILCAYHSSLTGCHQGINKMHNKMKIIVYWPNLQVDINKHVTVIIVLFGYEGDQLSHLGQLIHS